MNSFERLRSTTALRFAALCVLLLVYPDVCVQAQGIVLQSFSSGVVGGKSGALTPDIQLAVGASEVAVLTNGAALIYSKSGKLLQSLPTLKDFWTESGLSVPDGAFNPRIVYDPASQRYYATSMESPAAGKNANNLLLAVSKTGNLREGWKGYKIPTNPQGGDHFSDFDTLGFNNQGVFLSSTNYQSQGGPFVGANAFALDKAELLTLPDLLNVTASYERNAAKTGFSLQPVVDYDNGGTSADLDGKFIARYFTDSFAVSRFTGSLTDSSATYQAQGQNVFASNEGPPPAEGATQKGTSVGIDAGDNLLNSSVLQRGGNLYLVQGVSASFAQGGHAAIRLLVVRASNNQVLLNNIISDPLHDLYIPSVAVNDAGDVVIGYTASGPDIYASAYAVVGKLNEARTAAIFEAPLLLAAGNATYNVTRGGVSNRWGDYSATWIDPVDPTKFWTAQEYVTEKDQWGTRIAQISVGATAAPEPATGVLIIAGGLTALLSYGRRRA